MSAMVDPTAPHPPARLSSRYDAVVVGGGHNGLTAAAYAARAGRSVLVLERADHVGGAAVSARPFPGVDARLSRYSYLVSLLPRRVVDELGLPITLRRRRYSSYTPVGDGGLLVDTQDDDATRASFRRLTGSDADVEAWGRFYAMTAEVARRLAPTLTEPLLSRAAVRDLVVDGVGEEAWRALFEEPLGGLLRRTFADDVVRGVAATDGLIGTFADLDEPSLRQNRCFLYHVIGNGTGDWDVPVGGMGAVSGALRDAAVAAGATILTSATVTAVDPGAAGVEITWTDADGHTRGVTAGHVLAGCAPAELDRLLAAAGRGAVSGPPSPAPAPEGAQLKVNMLLRRLPRLRDGVDPVAAFSGTLHVNESLTQLQDAYAQAAAGRIPDLPPSEIYCHTLSDRSILGPDLAATDAQTITLFGLHMPARLFRADPDGARERALAATLASLNSVLAEPIEDVLATDADGAPCLEVRTPVDLEGDVGLPGGHIFHRDLTWPFAESDDDTARWGVETEHHRVLLAGAGARRGGGVSGIPGRAAAMALLAP
ncbi:Phytoene dehydrogenase-related protein [Promicromonospora thailandica]|uniref:Phytoene dehydrogenase-related protein n=2 Tax=Promicromonospora thailandica TaxID=765201 RepID=A0A9X2G1R8_9MICO|nr:Phytoene dehydrogenase-related protein [Promicromonospora thailandica]BFF20993.1 NAD(P)/FAD-dependent oxidoreductase [Promicromonospora thailandica]